jgi:hypothetical protein
MTAAVGAGLSTGHMLQLVERVNKFEADARAAEAKLARVTADYTKEIEKLKADGDAAAKRLTDKYAADMKKAADAHAEELKKVREANATAAEKLKADYAAEAKKLTDKYAAEMKRLETDHAAAVKRLEADHAGVVKKLEAEVALERERTAEAVRKARVDLANAMTPGQALDMWLPLLTGLRRPSDADPAIAAADRALKAYPADSEDAAKAMTVTGIALVLKGDYAGAKQMFVKARGSPAYRLAAGRADWAKAADVGLASIDDPAAALRRPAETLRKDANAAVRLLDAGIKAYRDGRYADAVKALTESAWNDESDPLAWYFLGAARWAAGDAEKARDDFRQGAEREKARAVPARVIDAAISPIQGPARDALNKVRP